METFIGISVFLGVLFFVLALFMLEKDRREACKTRFLKKMSAPSGRGGAGTILKKDRPKGVLRKILGRFIDPSRADALLTAADVNLSLERYLLLCLGCGLVLLLASALFFPHPLILVLLPLLGTFAPVMVVLLRKKRRESALVAQLPDAIDAITRAIRAGQSVDSALMEVSRSLPAPVGTEVRTIYDEMAMGLAFETAIRNFEGRFPMVSDVKILCSAFIIQREAGGSLTHILQGLSTTIRERFKLKQQVHALTAEGRVTAIILAAIPLAFAFLTWLLNPTYISLLFVHPMGKMLLAGAICLEVMGFLIMRNMAKIEV
jgi:tight adherence protein B